MTSEFIDFMARNGVEIKDASDIVPTAHSKLIADIKGKKRIYYSYQEDGGSDRAWGHFYDCRSGEGKSWVSKSVKRLSKEERDRIDKKREAMEAAAKAEIDAMHEKTAQECKAMFTGMKKCESHPYLIKKKVPPAGVIRQNDNLLVFPIVDLTGKIWSLQTIDENGDKNLIWKGKKQGNFFPIGIKLTDTPERIYICEGLATGLAVYQATQKPTIVAIDAGNLKPVALALRNHWRKSEFIFAADNDEKAPGEITAESNPGVFHAERAAVLAGNSYVIYPDTPGFDWNDVLCENGVEAVTKKLALSGNTQEDAPPAGGSVSHPLVADDPAAGDVTDYESHDIDYYIADLDDNRPSDLLPNGNPKWFNEFIWTKDPVSKLERIIDIADRHDGRSLANRVVFIDNYWKGLFVLNEFSDEIIVRTPPPWLKKSEEHTFRVHRLGEDDVCNLMCIMEHFGFTPDKDKTRQAIYTVAVKNKVHPVRNYFKSLKWDGVDRLKYWLERFAGANSQPPEYLSKVGTTWLVAAVTRIFNPGAKFDHMLVLEGSGGIGKSTLLREIATFGRDVEESYFSDSVRISDIEKPLSIILFQGNLVIEFSELAGLDKVSNESLKNWITVRYDEVIKKYQNERTVYPRQFVLSGTTNTNQWLKDPDGNRRYWPVKCSFIDIPGLRREREQLWAEAVHLYNTGYEIYIRTDDPIFVEAAAQQQARMITDPWEEVIEKAIWQKPTHTYNDIYEYIGVRPEMRNFATDSRIRSIMKSLKYEYRIAHAASGSPSKVWIRK